MDSHFYGSQYNSRLHRRYSESDSPTITDASEIQKKIRAAEAVLSGKPIDSTDMSLDDSFEDVQLIDLTEEDRTLLKEQQEKYQSLKVGTFGYMHLTEMTDAPHTNRAKLLIDIGRFFTGALTVLLLPIAAGIALGHYIYTKSLAKSTEGQALTNADDDRIIKITQSKYALDEYTLSTLNPIQLESLTAGEQQRFREDLRKIKEKFISNHPEFRYPSDLMREFDKAFGL